MQFHLQLLSWRGHQYDVRVLGATFEFVALRSETEQALAAGHDPGVAGLFALEAGSVVLARARDVHQLAGSREEGGVCSCALVVPDGLSLSRATGHLDQRVWETARTIVVTEERGGGWDDEPGECLAYCQDCGWSTTPHTAPRAHRAARLHGCPASTT
jgi:hypothetical protein